MLGQDLTIHAMALPCVKGDLSVPTGSKMNCIALGEVSGVYWGLISDRHYSLDLDLTQGPCVKGLVFTSAPLGYGEALKRWILLCVKGL